MSHSRPAFLEIKEIHKEFHKPFGLLESILSRVNPNLKEEIVYAVSGVSFKLDAGEVVGLAGESGCGKSTIGRIIAGINTPTSGQILYKGQDVLKMNQKEFREYALNVQMIFQDPYACLNPRLRVRDIVSEAPLQFGIWPKGDPGDEKLNEILLQSGLDPSYANRYPHQFSGGQRQRIGIARGLAVNPECLVCDETVASLDVSIQAQMINLFIELRNRLDLTYLFISHDLGVIEAICDRVLIMYLGEIVESAETITLFNQPKHPYTQLLLSAVPRLRHRKKSYSPITGETPSPINPPSGCRFHPRCPYRMEQCSLETPVLKEVAKEHQVACHLFCDTTSPQISPEKMATDG